MDILHDVTNSQVIRFSSNGHLSKRAVGRGTLALLVRSRSPEQMERFSRPNFLLIAPDPDTSQPTTTVTRRTAQTIPYHFSIHLFLSLSLFSPSSRLSSSDRLTHTRTYTMQNV